MNIWSKYWGYIVSIPIIIICVAHIFSSIADFQVTDEEPLAANTERTSFAKYAEPPSVANRPIAEQEAQQRTYLAGMPDEQFKKVVDESPDLARSGVRYEIQNGKMIRYIPDAATRSAEDNKRPPVNDETYNVRDTVPDSGRKQPRAAMQRKPPRQPQQQQEIYR